jgi:DNA repair protein RecO (recombination protein O)
MAGRGYKTEAVVLRSLRFGEADRVLHLYTLERGRVGAVAKGIRRTKSRFGARLEPLSHAEVMLHQGSGELATVTGASLEAMLRLFVEQERNPKAFEALTRFLDVLDEADIRGSEPALDPLVLSFQLKLLWLSGYLPHLTSCAECGAEGPLVGYSPRAGGAVCERCGADSLPLSGEGIAGIEGLLGTPLADAAISKRAAREALRVITSSYEYHGGFRLRTLAARA